MVRALQFRRSLVIVPLLLVAFSGCVVGESATTDPPATAASLDEDKGAIQGTIINDEGLPIANVLVGILETNEQTMTAQSGEYTFSNVVPGAITVSATILGYESASKRVTVEAGAVAQANFQLLPISIEEPFYVSLQDVGNIQCSVTWFPGAPLGDPVTGFPGDPGWYTSLQACGALAVVPGANSVNPLPPSKFDLTF
ncbi:MAG TPA: carboxypeptidase-like regulatory domain-containing protein, partial [Candidatus Thermoplasmatota archaeon]